MTMNYTAKELHIMLKAAWQKCEDAWQAAGAYYPCHEENYMKAREEYAALLKEAKMLA